LARNEKKFGEPSLDVVPLELGNGLYSQFQTASDYIVSLLLGVRP
jgi:hypothetical protein